MANELIHGTVGVAMTQAEFEAVGLHVCNSQATGDLIYASSSTQLSRLAAGAQNTVLVMGASVPSWSATLSGLTFVAPALGAATATSLATSAAIPLLLTNGQLVNISLTSQTVGATTLTIPDFASVVDEFVFKTKAVTMSNKTFVAPVLGAATATSINGLTITTTAGTLTIANSASAALVTSGNYSLTLTATGATNVTLPTTGTLATLAGTEELDNKTLDSSVAKGTWTASGTWTIPAVTLGGAVTLQSSQTFASGAGATVLFSSTAANYTLQFQSTTAISAGPIFNFVHLSGSPDAADRIGMIRFTGYDAGLNGTTYGDFLCAIVNPAQGAEEAKYEWYLINVTANLAMTLSAAGVLAVDLAGSGTAAQVDLFDQYDDALVLRQGIQLNNRELLADMGVLTRKDTGSGYMMNLQPMVRLLAGGVYQTRQILEDTREELLAKLADMEVRLTKAGLN